MGVRVLTGSEFAEQDSFEGTPSPRLVPTRFADDKDYPLALSMTACIKTGPPRYEIGLRVSGHLTTAALGRLAKADLGVWQRFFLTSGLWIGDADDILPFIDVCQILDRINGTLDFRGVFLHSDLARSLQQGIMVLATLYRSVLDEVNDVCTFGPLFRRLEVSLPGSHRPRFRGEIRP